MVGFVFLGVIAAVLIIIFLPQLSGWRTRIAAAATSIIGGAIPLLSTAFDFLNGFDWQTYIDDKRVLAAVLLFIGVVFAILREITTGPAGGK